jgi:bifunctional non-homologous end joining protein LigD
VAAKAKAKARAKHPRTEVQVEVEGRTLTLVNLDKPMYPGGFTKAQVIDYYRRIAPAMLPHIRGRPLTRVRYPHGTQDKSFFEKRIPAHAPAWIARAEVEQSDEVAEYVVCNDVPTLVWLANMAALELHPQLHLASKPERPTVVVFDLDPGLPAALRECCDVALVLKDLFAALGLQCFPKQSGGKGMQLYVPLHTPATYEQTKHFAKTIAQTLEKDQPGKIISRMPKAERKGKVFIDWSQNDEVKTTVAVYSMRGRERPTASAPLAWEEVEQALDDGDASGLVFEAPDVLARVEEQGDLFAPVASLKQKLPAL